MKTKTYTPATIRQDLLKSNTGVPVGNEYYFSDKPLPSRYVNDSGEEDEEGEQFQVLHNEIWKDAYSIDFE